jgi:hypothetical protein
MTKPLRMPRQESIRRRSRRVCLFGTCLLMVCTTRAFADGPRVDPRIFIAAPDSPVATVGTRKQTRAKAALVLPLVGGPFDSGFSLRIPAFIELHNVLGAKIPSEFWRGRITLDGSVGFPSALGEGSFYRMGVALEHESDHSSISGYDGFLKLNSAALSNEATLDLGNGFTFFAGLTAHFHLSSCTVQAAICSSGGGTTFESRAFEVSLDGVLDKTLGLGFRAFTAVHAARMFGHRYVANEQRGVVDLGVAWTTKSKGTFQLYGTGFVGTEVGFFRGSGDRPQWNIIRAFGEGAPTGQEAVQLGGGIRWAP